MIKKILGTMLLTAIAIHTLGNNNDYDNYRTQIKEKLGIKVSIPEKRVDFQTESHFATITFGEQVTEVCGLPGMNVGPIVKLSEYCSVIMMDAETVEKPRPESFPKRRTYNFPAATSWMLNNCDTPWAEWYINNNHGVIIEDEEKLTEEEQATLHEKVSVLRVKNERCIKSTELTQNINCDRVFIVRIPNIEKVGTHRSLPEYACPKLDAELKAAATECYGVEFYKYSAFIPFRMLFFINGSNTTIDECVTKMADYILFE